MIYLPNELKNSRYVQMRSEDKEFDCLTIKMLDSTGKAFDVLLHIDFCGLSFGDTRISWKAWDFIAKQVELKRKEVAMITSSQKTAPNRRESK